MNQIISKLKQKGFRWFIWRLGCELRTPSNPLFKLVMDKLLFLKKITSKNLDSASKDEFLYVICDLDINAITFNMTEVLVDAEYESNKRGKAGFVLVFVPRSNDPRLSNKEYDAVIDNASKQWKFQNVVLPVTMLSRKCEGVNILPKRSDAIAFVKGREIFPELYDGVNLRGTDVVDLFRKLDRPNLVEGLRAPKQGLRYVKSWVLENGIKDPIVTITIRDYMYDKARNSNIEACSQFANYLDSRSYHAVMIPDTDNAFCEDHRFKGLTVFKECAWNIGLRASLYESAFLNFFPPTGPSQLAVYNPQCSYIQMNSLPEGSIVTTKEAYGLIDHPIGSNYKFATPNQRLCFKPDTFENMVSEFERFVKDQNCAGDK
jgi:hypothetical protein